MSATIPAGMLEVSQEQFFAALRADRRDIMPSHREPLITSWEVTATRERWGWSYPGWKNTGEPKRWALSRAQEAVGK